MLRALMEKIENKKKIQREKTPRQTKQTIPELWDNIKTIIPEGGENGTEGIFQLVISENFPKLMTDTNPGITEHTKQETYQRKT